MKKLFLLTVIALIACTTPESPAQAVYAAESNYASALRIELAYTALPRCGKPSGPQICSQASVIKKVQIADNIAWSAIQQAQVAVRTNGFGKDKIATTIASAISLTKAFVEITNQLEVK